jgi:hypothetical protein
MVQLMVRLMVRAASDRRDWPGTRVQREILPAWRKRLWISLPVSRIVTELRAVVLVMPAAEM